MLWETFGSQHHEMRRMAQTIRRMVNVAESHQYSVEAEWGESALWAKAWHHAWTRNALKKCKWMNQMLHRYTKKKESLWAITKKEGRKGERKRQR